VEPAIQIEGLRELAGALRRLGTGAHKAMRLAGNEAADIVVQDARGRVPTKTGAARASIKTRSTQSAVRISSGGKRAPYFPWLDYGGRVGPNKSVKRPFIADGRYIYPAFGANRRRVEDTYRAAILRIAADAGLET
jgi:hypothetical protein